MVRPAFTTANAVNRCSRLTSVNHGSSSVKSSMLLKALRWWRFTWRFKVTAHTVPRQSRENHESDKQAQQPRGEFESGACPCSICGADWGVTLLASVPVVSPTLAAHPMAETPCTGECRAGQYRPRRVPTVEWPLSQGHETPTGLYSP